MKRINIMSRIIGRRIKLTLLRTFYYQVRRLRLRRIKNLRKRLGKVRLILLCIK